MGKEVLISADGVSKKFCRSLKKSLYYGVCDLKDEILRKSEVRELRGDEFWALDDINFELKRGECLGIIGPNGAGKSTLLKVLNGLIKPDRGEITINGKVGALIELGAGFNPILTGRENIYINGAVLGFTKSEIDKRLEDIISFSELEDFIDMPVQNYSSGMKVRLGFAVAAQMEPDILLIDEVLAVGDIGFRNKCYGAIDKLVSNAAVIFVTHNMVSMTRLCDRCMVIHKGKNEYLGEPTRAQVKYTDLFSRNPNIFTIEGNQMGEMTFSPRDNEGANIQFGKSGELNIKVFCKEDYESVIIKINITSSTGQYAASYDSSNEDIFPTLFKGWNDVRMVFPQVDLIPGDYYISFFVFKGKYDIVFNCIDYKKFKIDGGLKGIIPYQLSTDSKKINVTRIDQ